MKKMRTLTINGTTYEVVDETARNMYSYGTEDLVAGESSLEAGRLYFVYDGPSWSSEATPIIITMTIDNTSYSAEEGMTWGAWVGSKYNTVGASIEANGTITNTSAVLWLCDDTEFANTNQFKYTYSTDVVMAGHQYIFTV